MVEKRGSAGVQLTPGDQTADRSAGAGAEGNGGGGDTRNAYFVGHPIWRGAPGASAQIDLAWLQRQLLEQRRA